MGDIGNTGSDKTPPSDKPKKSPKLSPGGPLEKVQSNNKTETSQIHSILELLPDVSPEQKREALAQAQRLKIEPLKPTDKKFDAAIRSTVLWAVTDNGDLLILPKKVGKEETSHIILSNENAAQAVGTAKLFGSDREYLLATIDATSKQYQTNEQDIEIGRKAFERAGIPDVNEALKALEESMISKNSKEMEPRPERVRHSRPANFETTLTGGQERMWETLNAKGSDQRLSDTSIKYVDETGSYTTAEVTRAEMAVSFASELSPKTKEIRDQFKPQIAPCRDDDVIYDHKYNRLLIPIEASPLKVVLSTIVEMDHAKYAWASGSLIRDSREQLAQEAATALRMIKVCQKLGQPNPFEHLQGLTLQYNEIYKEETSKAQMSLNSSRENVQEAAQRRFFEIFGASHGVEDLGLSQVDSRKYEIYVPMYRQGVEQRPSSEEMRWKIFSNDFPRLIIEETKETERAGVVIAKFGDPHFDEVIGQGRSIWVISMGEEIIVCPRFTNNFFASHAVLANGKPVLATGEADIIYVSGKGYILNNVIEEYDFMKREYNLSDMSIRSGHYLPRWKLLHAVEVFKRHGFQLPSFK